MLRCSDGSYYAGSTRTTLERRVTEHNEGKYPGYTKSRRNSSTRVGAARRRKPWSRDGSISCRCSRDDARNMIKNASWFETPPSAAPHHEKVFLKDAPRRMR